MIEATSTTTVYTVPISAKNTRAGLSCETYKVARGTQQVSICCSPNHYKPHQPHTVSWLRLMPLMMPLPFWGAMLVTRAPLTPEHSAWRDTGAGNSAARQRRNSDGTDVLEVTHVATVAGKHAAVERFLWHARGRAVARVLPPARPATLWPIQLILRLHAHSHTHSHTHSHIHSHTHSHSHIHNSVSEARLFGSRPRSTHRVEKVVEVPSTGPHPRRRNVEMRGSRVTQDNSAHWTRSLAPPDHIAPMQRDRVTIDATSTGLVPRRHSLVLVRHAVRVDTVDAVAVAIDTRRAAIKVTAPGVAGRETNTHTW